MGLCTYGKRLGGSGGINLIPMSPARPIALKRDRAPKNGRLATLKSDETAVQSAFQNKLLAALPELDWLRVRRHFSLMDVQAGKTLYEARVPLRFAFFPTTSIISIQNAVADGASTEVCTIGNEGLVGVTAMLGAAATSNRVVVQSGGHGYRIKIDDLKAEFNRGGAMQQLLLRYTLTLIRQICQAALCNQHHSIDQQLCRWLLMSLDRVGSDDLTMTHEILANTLGVRREGITEAARKLQNAGLISYRRGRITVLDRAGVEACCCECYAVVRGEYDRLPRPSADTLSVAPHATPPMSECATRDDEAESVTEHSGI